MDEQRHSAAVPQSDAVDVSDVLRGVARRWPMVMAFTVIALVGAIAFVTTAKVKYTSTAKIIVENLATPFTQVQTTNRAKQRVEDRDVLSQVEVLTSRNLAADVIDRRVSDRTRALLSRKGSSLVSSLLNRIGLGTGARLLNERERALAKFSKNLTVYRKQRSSVIVIEYKSSRPAVSAEIANAVADAYVKATRDAQTAPINVARDWLSEQIEQLREKVVKSEVAVEEYRATAGLIRGSTVKLSNQELSELNSQIILAAASRSEAEARANSIREMLASTGTVDGASDVLNSAFIQRLREQQVRLRRRLAELSSTYLENHPRIVGTRRELADLNKQVRGEVLKIVNGLEQQAKIAATREAALRKSLQDLKGKATATNVDEVKLRALEREATSNRTLLETFLTRYNDASSRDRPNAQPGLARVISTAAVPSIPSFPKKAPIVALSTIAGLVLGLGLAFLIEVMAAAAGVQRAAAAPVIRPAPQPVSPPSPVMPVSAPLQAGNHNPKPGTGAPVTAAFVPPQVPPVDQPETPSLCQVPDSPSADTSAQNALSVVTHPEAEYAMGARTITSWALGLRQTLSVNRLVFASLPNAEPDAAAGVIATARILAAQNLRVVVIDCDFDRGLLIKTVPGNPGPGLAELIAGSATFSDVIVCDPSSQAHVIQIGQMIDQARQVLDASRLNMVLEALEHAYDFVLISAGKAEFPAVQQQFALLSGHAVLVFAQVEFAGPAAALCGSLMQAGQKAAQYVAVSDGAGSIAAQRIAAAVNG